MAVSDESVVSMTNGLPSLFATISGLDVQDGLRRVLGKETLYQSMLQKFIHGQSQFVLDFRSAAESGDLALAKRLAHTLKGVAANIGAHDVSANAAGLERLVEAGLADSNWKSDLETVSALLDRLITDIQQALMESNADVDGVKKSANLDAAQVNRLLKLLVDHDAEAQDVFDQMASGLKQEYPLIYGQIKTAIDTFDFAKAHELLNRAVSSP